MAGNNLKTVVTADTSRFKKGMREAKGALKDFERQGSSALSGIAGMFDGVDESLGGLTKNVRNATALLGQMGEKGAGAFSGLTSGAKLLGGAIAGLGITAALAGFKELNRSAEIFRSTIEGTNLELQTKAYVDTFRVAMEDRLGNGASLAGTARWAKEAGTRIGSTVGNMAIAAFSTLRPFDDPGTGLLKAVDAISGVWKASKEADQAARNAKTYQGELNRVLDERLRKTNDWKDLQFRIAQSERVAADTEATKEEREEAIANARELQNRLYGEQISLAKQIYKWSSLISDEATDSREETEQLIAAEGAILDLQRQREESGRHLDKLASRVANAAGERARAANAAAAAAKDESEATALTLAAATELVVKQRELKALQDQNAATMFAARTRLDGALPAIAGGPLSQASGMAIEVPIRPVVDTNATQKAILDLADVIEQGVVGMSESIGYLIADLVNGENAWGNFAQAGIAVVADMLATVGKAFVTTGVGVVAAQSALKTGNGVGAIVAGSAMVALAAAMKGVMSNAASNWSGGYSSSVASSSYTQGAYGQSTFGREMTVQVTGTLTADGSKLVAVLNNEGKRKDLTT